MIRQDIQNNLLKKFIDSSDELKIYLQQKQELHAYVFEVFIKYYNAKIKDVYEEFGNNTFKTTGRISLIELFDSDFRKTISNLESFDLSVDLNGEYPCVAYLTPLKQADTEERRSLIEKITKLSEAKKKLQELKVEISSLLGETYLTSELLKKHIPDLFK